MQHSIKRQMRKHRENPQITSWLLNLWGEKKKRMNTHSGAVLGSLDRKERGGTEVRRCVPPHRAAFVGFPQQLWMQMVSFLLFSFYQGRVCISPEFYNSCSFTRVFIAKEQSATKTARAFACPYILRLKNKRVYQKNLCTERRQRRAVG